MLDLDKKNTNMYDDTYGTYNAHDTYNNMPEYGNNSLMNSYDNAPNDLYRSSGDPMYISNNVRKGTSRPDYKPFIRALPVTAILCVAVYLAVSHFANNNAPIGFGMIFFISGSMIFWTSLFSEISKKKICTQPVMAVCHDLHVSHSRDSDGSSSTTYSPVWRYYFDGNYYEHHESSSSNVDVPRVGEQREIMVDPNDPLTIYRKSIPKLIFMLIFSLVFMAVPIFMAMIK
ncbi:MAG: DUF3592 domain-containing protein [Ruminococcus sp.]|uniref:DUF3592 domain-containing protein n=1 Tax=Ruminococcus sp. TaxID=41978 RepID=UPI0025E708D4|nr:DUF3592 domain-containing protein [Ruminococcus sp.]MBO4867540.1 DUF3592 domain-containing protein [Ruminococcus sp.]